MLEELKALIGQLDPATKATMKDSLYRISRNAAVGVLHYSRSAALRRVRACMYDSGLG